VKEASIAFEAILQHPNGLQLEVV